jgi:hypothetical protein
LNYALTQVFLFSAVLVSIAFVVTLFLKEIPLRTSNEEPGAGKVELEKA